MNPSALSRQSGIAATFSNRFELEATARQKSTENRDSLKQSVDPANEAGSANAKPDATALSEVLEQLNGNLASNGRIRFEIAEDGDGFQVQVVDSKSDEVIRTIPHDRLEAFRRNLQVLAGVALDTEA